MKKAILAIALVALGCGSANAQTGLEKAKFFDNWYLGAKIGASTPLTFNKTFPLNPNFGLKLGKNFSPVFGANIEALANFGDNRFVTQIPENMVLNSKTFVKSFNLGVNGTINWTNLFLGYNENKVFEVGTELGVGFTKYYGDKIVCETGNVGDDNDLTAKTSMTFAWNIGGASKPWQVYVEPGIYWNLTHGPKDAVQMDKRCAQLALQVGFNYKFKTSNGTHNFKKIDLTPLNDEINDLRAQLAQKPKEVIKEVIKEVPVEVEKHTTKTNTVRIDNLFFVTFQQGKSALVPEMKKALNNIKSGSHVEIVGTASPEGPKELNDRLSQARADVVANYLKTRGVIVDSASGKGVQGVTSNRLAVVYVK